MLCLWILCGILSVHQGTIRGLLASSIYHPLFVLLIFSTSSVNKLWVYNCLEQFLYLGPFGSIWYFLWSSSQVLAPLVSICSFQVLVCREWRRISWTIIHLFNYVQVFSSLISFFMSFGVIRCVFPFWGLLRAVLVLLSYRLSIQPFRYAFSVAIFSSKIVQFPWRLVIGMFLCHALPIVDKIFFCFFLECSVLSVLFYPLSISL